MILRENTESTSNQKVQSRRDPQQSPLDLPSPRRPPPIHTFSSSTGAQSMPTGTAASSLSRARHKASAMLQQSSTYIAPKIGNLSDGISRSIHKVDSWETPRGMVTTPKGVKTRGKQPSMDYFAGTVNSSRSSSPGPVDPQIAAESKSQTPAAAPSRGWGLGGITSYFSGASRETRDKDFYSEEKIVSFPGWATLRPSAHSASEPALVLEILAHGYAYRLRPISQASRSQRIFYSLAKSFAALPRIPAHLMPAGAQDISVTGSANQSVESLPIASKDSELTDENKDSVFERLLEIGGRDAGQEELLTQEPEEMLTGEKVSTPTQVLPDGEPPAAATPAPTKTAHFADQVSDEDSAVIVAGPAKIARRPRIVTRPSQSGKSSKESSPPDSPATRSRPASIITKRKPDRASTLPISPTSSSFPSRSASPTSSGASTPKTYSGPGSVAQSRSTSPNRAKRPVPPPPPPPGKEEWPKPFAYTEDDLPRLHANLQERLLAFFGQKIASRKVRLSVYPDLEEGKLWDKPLASKVVTTSAGGAFRTNMEVRSKDLRRLLEEKGQSVDYLESMRIKIVAELLEVDPIGDALTGGRLMGHQGLSTVTEDETTLIVGRDGGVRVISDIDDTIKWTEVLGGTKKIFRNVFVRELHEIRVPGMAEWYRAMEKRGAHFHYVSNSPWELWSVVKSFLSQTIFPLGSVTLKEYGGASQAIAKLWEEPGMRKRAGVENIIKEFPHCKFLLVGDSGEQDLNLYVSLAQQYPDQVLGIFIRDVTTPFSPNAHPFDASGKPMTPATPSRKSTAPSTASSSGASSKNPSRSATAASDPTVPPHRAPSPPLFDQDTDALSPNNPLRPEPGLGPTQSEQGAALVEHFYERIVAAEKVLPPNIPLRIFRHGKECLAEGVRLCGP